MMVEEFYFPDNLLYSRKHTWVKAENEKVTVGLTSLGQSLAKGIVHVDLPPIGQNIKRNGVMVSLETIKAVVKVTSPLTGKILEVNEVLKEKPEKINEDPYGEGWICKIYPTRNEEFKKLLNIKEAAKYFEKVIRKERESYGD
ncbi:MAG: glycine cleavage system protein GcvH [Candidatus Bathyarchaeota archaeon]|nr:glycine cleavage system protein GcvH [Candidatus Bathyarchaeota archaeon]